MNEGIVTTSAVPEKPQFPRRLAEGVLAGIIGAALWAGLLVAGSTLVSTVKSTNWLSIVGLGVPASAVGVLSIVPVMSLRTEYRGLDRIALMFGYSGLLGGCVLFLGAFLAGAASSTASTTAALPLLAFGIVSQLGTLLLMGSLPDPLEGEIPADKVSIFKIASLTTAFSSWVLGIVFGVSLTAGVAWLLRVSLHN